jgi:hypothetical protein
MLGLLVGLLAIPAATAPAGGPRFERITIDKIAEVSAGGTALIRHLTGFILLIIEEDAAVPASIHLHDPAGMLPHPLPLPTAWRPASAAGVLGLPRGPPA